jgi:magnesium transporter
MSASQGTAVERLVDGLFRLYPSEAARRLEDQPLDQTAELLERQGAARAAPVLDRLAPDVAASVLERIAGDRAGALLAALEPQRAAALLARLDERRRGELLAALGPQAAREMRELLSYPPDTAGHLMDPRVTALRGDVTVGAALARIRASRSGGAREVFLIDEEGQLDGWAPLHEIALSEPGTPLESLRRPLPAGVEAMAPREDMVEALSRTGLSSLPVVDAQGKLIGVIRHAALVAAAQEEASVDIQTMVGASREERALSPVRFAVRKRLPWLEINLATAFLASAVVGLFEDTIARFTALAVLLPVVAGQSGNTGAQALAVTMRGLALREIRLRHGLRVIGKEVFVGMVNGVAVAATTAAAVYAWSRSWGLASVIGFSMVISMTVAGLAGATVPMALTAAGQDPAQSSSIILTTVTDVVGFLSFLGIATLLAGAL